MQRFAAFCVCRAIGQNAGTTYFNLLRSVLIASSTAGLCTGCIDLDRTWRSCAKPLVVTSDGAAFTVADQGDDLSVEFLLPTTSNVNRLNQRLFGDSPSVAFFTTRLPSGLTMTPFDVLAAGSSPGRASVVAAPFIGGEISATELNYLEVKRYYVFKRFELYLDQVDSVSILGPFRELRMAVGEDGRFKVVNPRRAGFLLIPGVTRSVFLNGRSDDSDIQRLKLHGPRHGGIPGVFVIKVDGPQKKE